MNSGVAISNEILEHALQRYSTSSSEAAYIGGHQNIVYEYKQDGRSFILRLTPSANRSERLVQSELDWILFLADAGISVSKPIPSKNGQWTEVVPLSDGGCYTCVVFEKALGRQIGYPECLEDHDLHERLGRLTGSMHALSQTYQPQAHTVSRHDWRQNWFLQHMNLLPESHAGVRAACLDLIETISALPQDTESYGLIHGDIGVANFCVDEHGGITLFDFDEAQYSWFAEDIALQLYYLVYVYGGEDGKEYREDQARRFMAHFMKGYRQEHALDDDWLGRIPLFLRLRELIVYIGSFRNWDGDETFGSSDNQWFKDWIAESKARIENGIPIVNIWT